MSKIKEIWQQTSSDLLTGLQTGENGLSAKEAAHRLEKYGPNELREGGKKSTARGIKVRFEDEQLIIDALIMVRYGNAVAAVAKKVQSAVTAAVSQLVR